MYLLTLNGIKLCRTCGNEKPLSEFRLRKKVDNAPAYGRCKTCERTYDALRRIQKGLKKTVLKKDKSVSTIAEPITKFKRIRYYLPQLEPRINKNCKECGVLFEGTKVRLFCTTKCNDKHHRRIRKRKERARMRAQKVQNVNPITVFESFNWHCANCGCYTPRHLKGKQKDNSPELDHIMPLSLGGDHSYTNTQLLCRLCNGIKSNRYAA